MSALSAEASLPGQSTWMTQSQTSHLSQSSGVSLDPPLVGPEDTFGFRSQQSQQQQHEQPPDQQEQGWNVQGEDFPC